MVPASRLAISLAVWGVRGAPRNWLCSTRELDKGIRRYIRVLDSRGDFLRLHKTLDSSSSSVFRDDDDDDDHDESETNGKM